MAILILDQEHIDALIAAHLQGSASPEEEKELMQWLDAAEENRSYFQDLEFVFHASASIRQVEEVDADKAWNKVEQQLSITAKRYWLGANGLQIAAALIGLAVVASITFWMVSRPTEGQLYTFAAGEQEQQIFLPDSTEVTLSPGSKIEESKSKGQRRYVLTGKGSFTIHEAEEQFVLEVGKLEIYDIGTSFEVDARSDSTFVEVSSGIVSMEMPNGRSLVLNAGDKGYLVKSTGRLSKVKPGQVKRLGSFNFENEYLLRVTQEVGSHFGVQIELVNPDLANCKISVNFNRESLETILDIIALTHNLELKEQEGIYLFRGSACN